MTNIKCKEAFCRAYRDSRLGHISVHMEDDCFDDEPLENFYSKTFYRAALLARSLKPIVPSLWTSMGSQLLLHKYAQDILSYDHCVNAVRSKKAGKFISDTNIDTVILTGFCHDICVKETERHCRETFGLKTIICADITDAEPLNTVAETVYENIWNPDTYIATSDQILEWAAEMDAQHPHSSIVDVKNFKQSDIWLRTQQRFDLARMGYRVRL